MRALFYNELRKGRLLPIFGLSLGVLVIILRGMFGLYPPLLAKSVVDDPIVLVAVMLASYIIATIGGAGLFASEVERGTLAALLGLPISRLRIWLAKVAAGLILSLCASVLLVLPSLFALPGWGRTSQDESAFVAMLLRWPMVFSAAVFFSAVLEHMFSAFMAAILLSIGLIVLGAAMTQEWGGSLLGRSSAIDLSLWALAWSPGLLLGSLVALTRGEMLRSRRKWLLGPGVSALCAVTVVVAISGGFRWSTRYERPSVQQVDPVALSANGRVAALVALRSPVWRAASQPWYASLVHRETSDYRSKHVVLIDLRTGGELLIRRGEGTATISPDGRLAAILGEPLAITWRPRAQARYLARRRLEIRDIRSKRLIHEGNWNRSLAASQDETYQDNIAQVADWSPSGSWFGIEARKPFGTDYDCLVVTRSDGSNPRVIRLPLQTDSWFESISRRWAWDPSGRALYALARDPREQVSPVALVRYALGRYERTALWSLRDASAAVKVPNGYDWLTGSISASPDGRWIAVGLVAFPFRKYQDPRLPTPQYVPAYGSNERPLVFVFLVSADGKQSLLLSRTSLPNRFGSLEYVWSKDGSALYYLARSGHGTDSDLRLWHPGQIGATALLLPENSRPQRIGLAPGGKLLVWGDRDVLLADENGRVQPFPNHRVRALARQCSFLGLDDGGRAIVLKWDKDRQSEVEAANAMLGAVNLQTGAFKRIYP